MESTQRRRKAWKVEGPTDALALISIAIRDGAIVLSPDGLSARSVCVSAIVANSNGAIENPANCGWIGAVFSPHDDAVVLHDADRPGQEGATQVIRASGLPRPGWTPYLASIAASAVNAVLPCEIEESHGKDLRDFLCDSGTWESVEALASAATPSAAIDEQPDEQPDDPHRLARSNLTRYAKLSGGTIRYWRGEWFTWREDRGCYRKMAAGEARARLTESIRLDFEDRWREEVKQYRKWRASADYDKRADKGPPKVRRVRTTLVRDVEAATAGISFLPSSIEMNTWIDGREKRNYIAMENGILDMDRYTAGGTVAECLLPHSPEWFSLVRIPYAFDPFARYDFWDSLMNRWTCQNPEIYKMLQEFFGYVLMPTTDEQKFLVLEGEGSNGKSAFMAAMNAVVGEGNCTNFSLEDLCENPFARWHTVGKLLNVSADVGELERASLGVLRSLTSGDRQSMRRMYLPPVEAYPTARIVIAFNARPGLRDRTEAVWRRMLHTEWRAVITEREKIRGMDKPRWWNSSGHLSGLFNWSLAGRERLLAQRSFTWSEDSEKAKEDFRQEMNPARTFLLDCVEACGEEWGSTAAADVYAAYRKWCEANGHYAMSSGPFGKEIQRVYPGSERKQVRNGSSRVWVYTGIRLDGQYINGY